MINDCHFWKICILYFCKFYEVFDFTKSTVIRKSKQQPT